MIRLVCIAYTQYGCESFSCRVRSFVSPWETTIAQLLLLCDFCPILSSSTTQTNWIFLFVVVVVVISFLTMRNFRFCTSFSINIFMQPKWYLSPNDFWCDVTNRILAIRCSPFMDAMIDAIIISKVLLSKPWGWIIYWWILFILFRSLSLSRSVSLYRAISVSLVPSSDWSASKSIAIGMEWNTIDIIHIWMEMKKKRVEI